MCMCVFIMVRNEITSSQAVRGARSSGRNLHALLAAPVARPVACLFQRVCFQVLPEVLDFSSLLVVAGVGAARTAPWAPQHSLAAGAPGSAATG